MQAPARLVAAQCALGMSALELGHQGQGARRAGEDGVRAREHPREHHWQCKLRACEETEQGSSGGEIEEPRFSAALHAPIECSSESPRITRSVPPPAPTARRARLEAHCLLLKHAAS